MTSPGKKIVLGIVGGIGSGKTHVAAELARPGGALIVADLLGHEALRQPDLRDRVVERFGSGILSDGDIDRRKLARIVFADPKELRALEKIVFPFIERRIREEISRGQADPKVGWIVIDAAILLETGWSRVCDRVAFVDVPRDIRLARLQKQRAWSPEELSARESQQMPLDEKRQRADFVVDNSGSLEELMERLTPVLQNLASGGCKPPDS